MLQHINHQCELSFFLSFFLSCFFLFLVLLERWLGYHNGNVGIVELSDVTSVGQVAERKLFQRATLHKLVEVGSFIAV
jgi:hypothetical protein